MGRRDEILMNWERWCRCDEVKFPGLALGLAESGQPVTVDAPTSSFPLSTTYCSCSGFRFRYLRLGANPPPCT